MKSIVTSLIRFFNDRFIPFKERSNSSNEILRSFTALALLCSFFATKFGSNYFIAGKYRTLTPIFMEKFWFSSLILEKYLKYAGMVKVSLKTVQPIGTSKILKFTSVILFKFSDSQDIEILVPFAVYAERLPFTFFKIGMDLVGGSEKVTLQLD